MCIPELCDRCASEEEPGKTLGCIKHTMCGMESFTGSQVFIIVEGEVSCLDLLQLPPMLISWANVGRRLLNKNVCYAVPWITSNVDSGLWIYV